MTACLSVWPWDCPWPLKSLHAISFFWGLIYVPSDWDSAVWFYFTNFTNPLPKHSKPTLCNRVIMQDWTKWKYSENHLRDDLLTETRKMCLQQHIIPFAPAVDKRNSFRTNNTYEYSSNYSYRYSFGKLNIIRFIKNVRFWPNILPNIWLNLAGKWIDFDWNFSLVALYWPNIR